MNRLRNYWMLRALESDKTILFLVSVGIEENEAGGEFISTILNLEPGTVIGAGSNSEEAEEDVLEMFKEMVDHCLEAGTLSQLISDAKMMKELDFSTEKVMSAIAEAESHNDHEEIPSGGWLMGSKLSSSTRAAA